MKIITLFCILSFSACAQDSIWFANYLKQFESDSIYLSETALVNLKGETVNISDYKGKFLYIDIWATWCGACIANFPYETKLIERLESYGLDSTVIVMNICTASNYNDWKIAVDKFKPHGINLFAPDSSLIKKWKISHWPTYIIVNNTGRVVNVPDPAAVPLVDYLIYSTVKGKDIFEAAWETQKYNERKKSGIQIADLERTPYDKWILEVKEVISSYKKWYYDYRKKIGATTRGTKN